MTRLPRVIVTLLLSLLVLTAHLAVVYFLPSPWNRLNLVMVVLTIVLIGWDTRAVVWFMFPFGLLLEQSSAEPFGVMLIAMVLSITIAYAVYRRLITNRSWYSALLLAMVAIFSYRLIAALLIIVSHSPQPHLWSLVKPTLAVIVPEVLLTGITTAAVAAVLSRFSARFRPNPAMIFQ